MLSVAREMSRDCPRAWPKQPDQQSVRSTSEHGDTTESESESEGTELEQTTSACQPIIALPKAHGRAPRQSWKALPPSTQKEVPWPAVPAAEAKDAFSPQKELHSEVQCPRCAGKHRRHSCERHSGTTPKKDSSEVATVISSYRSSYSSNFSISNHIDQSSRPTTRVSPTQPPPQFWPEDFSLAWLEQRKVHWQLTREASRAYKHACFTVASFEDTFSESWLAQRKVRWQRLRRGRTVRTSSMPNGPSNGVLRWSQPSVPDQPVRLAPAPMHVLIQWNPSASQAPGPAPPPPLPPAPSSSSVKAAIAAAEAPASTPGKRRRALKGELDALKNAALAELESARIGAAVVDTARTETSQDSSDSDTATEQSGPELRVADVMARPAVWTAARLCYPGLSEASIADKAAAVVLNFFKNPHDSRVVLGESTTTEGGETFQFNPGGRDATPDINAHTVVRVSLQTEGPHSVLVTWASAVELAGLWLAAGGDPRRQPAGSVQKMQPSSLRSAVHAALRGNARGCTGAFSLNWQVAEIPEDAGWAAGDQEAVRSASDALAFLKELHFGPQTASSPVPSAGTSQNPLRRRFFL